MKEFNSEIVAARIKKTREEKNLTQKQLAKALDISVASLQNYEAVNSERKDNNKRMSAETLFNMAQLLGVSVDYLLGLTNDRNKAPIAVDELGLSPLAVEKLRRIHDMPPQISNYVIEKYQLKPFNEEALDFYSMFISSVHIQSVLQECLPKLQHFYTLPEDVFKKAYAGMGEYHFASSKETVIKFNQFLIEREIANFIDYFCRKEHDCLNEKVGGDNNGKGRK